MAFQKPLLRHILVALLLRHPWLRKFLESHPPPVHKPRKGSLISRLSSVWCDRLAGFSLAYYRRPPIDYRCRVCALGQVAVVQAAGGFQAECSKGVRRLIIAAGLVPEGRLP